MKFLNKFILALLFFKIAAPNVYGQVSYGTSENIINEIKNQIITEFGEEYLVSVFNADSAATISTWEVPKKISDPYNQLQNSHIFLAYGIRQENGSYPESFIGIYRAGNIIWRSERSINSLIIRNPQLAGTLDLTNNNQVEIVTQWQVGMRGERFELWIATWDGNSGRWINQIDQRGRSNIKLKGYFDIIDVEGDNIFELSGKNFSQEEVQYEWDGNTYSKRMTQQNTTLPRNLLESNVKAKIETSADGNKFRYIVENDLSSQQKIEVFALNSSAESINNIQTPDYWWNFLISSKNLIRWFVRPPQEDFRNAFLEPGETDSAFSFKTEMLPRPVTYYIQGHNGVINDADDIFTNSVNGMTLGPAAPPIPFNEDTFADSLRSYLDFSCSNGWAGDAAFCNQLSGSLEAVASDLAAGDSAEAAADLTGFIGLIEDTNAGTGPAGASLTSEGYALLYFNAKYLLDRLPEPSGGGSGITCGCENPVTQSSGTITVRNGETRCLDQEFTGSVFFESGGTLNVCSSATLQNIYGNAPGVVNVSESGNVTVGNWNNNYDEDAITNWGTLSFSGQATVNQGALTNHGSLSISGGLNENNGPVVNHGTMDVFGAVNLNQPGNLNGGTWTTGGTLTLNSNATLQNSCRIETTGRLMINGSYSGGPGSFASSGQQLTVNSGGTLNMEGGQAMVAADRVMLNGAISASGGVNLLAVETQFQYNSGASVSAPAAPLSVCSPDFGSLPGEFDITGGCQLTIPASPCNPNGFNAGGN